MNIYPIKTRVFKEGENLFAFINNYIKKIPEGTVIVVTSKIVSLSENRTKNIESPKTKEKLIRSESKFAIPTKHVWLTLKNNLLMATAGIDESNAKNKLILLPKDSFKTASLLRKKLQQKFKLKKIGVLITDSRTMPLRAGVVGVALGYAGFEGLKDYRNTSDIFGRKFKYSKTNLADCLASAAVLLMGEGNEQQPLAIIKKTPLKFTKKTKKKELCINIKDDMYKPIFKL